MKKVAIENLTLGACVDVARSQRVVLTRGGNPVAVIVGLDAEQVQLGASDKFWKLIKQRRQEKTLSRAALEEKIKVRGKLNRTSRGKNTAAGK